MNVRFASEIDIEFFKNGLLDVRTIEKRPEKDIPVSEDDVNYFREGIKNKTIKVIDDEQGSPAAFIYFRTDFRVPYVHGDYLWIDIIYVREDQRGKGCGKILYEHAVDFARENGLDRIVIDIFDPNDRSKIFHSKLDFKPFYSIYTKQV
jgi:GNAT superfamily N-acetyltransferase